VARRGKISTVFAISPVIIVFALFLMVCVGVGAGALCGLLASMVLKLGTHGILKDAVLGGVGFLAGFFGSISLPWPQNTIKYHVGDISVASTMHTYQHPYNVAFAIALILPALHELYRFKQSRSL
jgi:hypothetical protein